MLSIELLRYDREPREKPEPSAEPAGMVRRESSYRSPDAPRSLRSSTLDPESVTVRHCYSARRLGLRSSRNASGRGGDRDWSCGAGTSCLFFPIRPGARQLFRVAERGVSEQPHAPTNGAGSTNAAVAPTD